jgi:hypothetical protein
VDIKAHQILTLRAEAADLKTAFKRKRNAVLTTKPLRILSIPLPQSMD